MRCRTARDLNLRAFGQLGLWRKGVSRHAEARIQHSSLKQVRRGNSSFVTQDLSCNCA